MTTSTTSPPGDRAARRTAAALFVALFVIYNLNGREIGTTDSQPAKFTAREVAVMGTLTLDRIVAERPGLGERPAFARARDGHVRSAYPLLPALIAAAPATALHRLGLVDMDAPLAPNLIAALTASAMTAAACALMLLALRRVVPLPAAFATSAALGLGTNYWALVSQTLWQHETVAFGLALTLWAWLRDDAAMSTRRLVVGGLGLAMAGAARPQTAPMILALIGWIAVRAGSRRAVIAAAIVGVSGALVVATNVAWFGHPLGAAPLLEAVHPAIHGVSGSFGAQPWTGALGLLVSPSRGLLVFSPVVLIALSGVGPARRSHLRLGWLLSGIAAQFAAYAAYSVWWAGHTFGPRYLLDLLPIVAPFAAIGWNDVRGGRAWRVAGGVLLGWSVGVAALGAFVYPNDGWNTRPLEVDRHHARLWEVRDSQIPRAIGSDASPQNGDLWTLDAIRRR